MYLLVPTNEVERYVRNSHWSEAIYVGAAITDQIAQLSDPENYTVLGIGYGNAPEVKARLCAVMPASQWGQVPIEEYLGVKAPPGGWPESRR